MSSPVGTQLCHGGQRSEMKQDHCVLTKVNTTWLAYCTFSTNCSSPRRPGVRTNKMSCRPDPDEQIWAESV
jgi:hypothetical protein